MSYTWVHVIGCSFSIGERRRPNTTRCVIMEILSGILQIHVEVLDGVIRGPREGAPSRKVSFVLTVELISLF